MELRVHLKVCEACGCLWFRVQAETSVYCPACYERFKDFPTPESRRRRGRPKKTTLPAVFAVEASSQPLGDEMGRMPYRGGQHSAGAIGNGFQSSVYGEASRFSLVAAQACGSTSLSAGAL